MLRPGLFDQNTGKMGGKFGSRFPDQCIIFRIVNQNMKVMKKDIHCDMIFLYSYKKNDDESV